MAQTIFPVTRTLLVAGNVTGGGRAVDVSAFGVPTDATGVILEVFNTNTGVRAWDVKKNGSTDNFLGSASGSLHAVGAVGLDADHKIYWVPDGDTPRFALYLLGYTMPGVWYFTNGTLISAGLVDATWTDIDLSTLIPANAKGVILRVNVSAPNRIMGVRMKGSTDNHIVAIGNLNNCFGAFIGCDVNRFIQGYRDVAGVNLYLMGYITAGMVFPVNSIDMGSPAAPNWADLPALPTNGRSAFVELYSGSRMWLREKGTDGTVYTYGNISNHAWYFSGADTDGIIQGFQTTDGGGFFVTAYGLGTRRIWSKSHPLSRKPNVAKT